MIAAWFHSFEETKAIGVAVSDSPTGPFIDAIGRPLVSDDMTSNGERGWWNDIDPTVLIDDDGTLQSRRNYEACDTDSGRNKVEKY